MRENAALNPTIGISDANSPSTANTPGVEAHPRPLTTAERADSGLLRADFHAGSGSTRSMDDGSLTGASEGASIRTLAGNKTPVYPPSLPPSLSTKSTGFLGPSKLGPGVGSASMTTGQANASVYTMHNADGTQKTSSSAAESASVQKALDNLQPEQLKENLGLGAPPASGLKLRNETLGEKLRDEIKEEEEREEANGGREMDLEREHRERERRERALMQKPSAQEEERPALEDHHREDSTKHVPQAQGPFGSIDSTVATPGHGSVHGVGGSRLVDHQQHQESIDSMVATAGHGHGHAPGGHGGVGLEGKGTVLPSAAREGKGVPDAPLADAQHRAAGTVDRQPNHNEDANIHAKDNSGPMSKVADAAVGKATDIGVRGAGTSHSMDKAKAQGSEHDHDHDHDAPHESKGKQKDEAENRPSSSEKDESSTMHPGVFSNTAGSTHPSTTPPSSHEHKVKQPTTITNPTPYKDDKAVQELYAKRGGAGLIGENTVEAAKASESTGKGGHDVGRGEHGASGSGAGGSVGGAGAGGGGGAKKPGFMQKLKGEMKVLTGKIEHKADKVQEGRRMMGKN
ncbi:hypothetical protein CPC08DRAFT_711391 [Agrocybe pediades]|nr:hypothetical protein CPC08DRAFT_711391 [Agrocybe pediades]